MNPDTPGSSTAGVQSRAPQFYMETGDAGIEAGTGHGVCRILAIQATGGICYIILLAGENPMVLTFR